MMMVYIMLSILNIIKRITIMGTDIVMVIAKFIRQVNLTTIMEGLVFSQNKKC
jgi:hypothetical protein